MGTPGFPQQYADLSRLVSSGQYPAALDAAARLLKASPRDANVLVLLAHAQRGVGRVREALVTLEKADAIAPGHPAIANPRGMLMMKAGRFDDARRLYERALAKHPDDLGLLGSCAQVLSMGGRHAEAWALLEPRVAGGGSLPPAFVLTLAKLARHVGGNACERDRRARDAVDRLARLLEDPSLPLVHRTAGLFELGALLDELGEFDRAFDAYARANASRGMTFDAGENAARFAALRQGFTRATLASLPSAGASGERAVLVVGMPRSATSLVEQIIASHPEAAGGDELPDLSRTVHALNTTPSHLIPMLTRTTALTKPELDRHARSYLETLRRISPTAKRVTDKTPLNFLHLGLAPLLLPGVRAVHCRRDPIDTCLSCYFQNFGGNNAFAYDLRHLGAFYREYERLMVHWKDELSIPMLDLAYERLVGDQAEESKRLVAFLGLEWDERCLRFHENTRIVQTASNDQVRRPMFASSIARWRRYEKHLGPLRKALESP
jgi:tetratricopeptide (TPR) repeat protein